MAIVRGRGRGGGDLGMGCSHMASGGGEKTYRLMATQDLESDIKMAIEILRAVVEGKVEREAEVGIDGNMLLMGLRA